MNHLHAKSGAFFFGCVIAAGAWIFFATDRESAETQQSLRSTASKSNDHRSRNVSFNISDLENAETDETRLIAARRLDCISSDQIQELLGKIELFDRSDLSKSAKLLLNRWDAQDGKAARDWAWRNLRMIGKWESAFNQIGPAWAWHHPESLFAWTKQNFEKTPISMETPSLADGAASQQPILESGQLTKIAKWLIPSDPRLAFETIKLRKGFSSEDFKIAASIQSVNGVREALLAFDLSKTRLKPNVFTGDDVVIFSLFGRWKELDPESFSHSPYLAMIPVSSPPIKSPISPPRKTVAEFSKWQLSKSPPPDMSGWSEAKKRAWGDLESLVLDSP